MLINDTKPEWDRRQLKLSETDSTNDKYMEW